MPMRNRSATHPIEQLEDRRLLATQVVSGVLTVDGTSSSETIAIFIEFSDIVVQIDGNEDGREDASGITGIHVNADDGDDTVTVGEDLVRATINGDEGDDVLDASAANARVTLDGGEGNDSLTG